MDRAPESDAARGTARRRERLAFRHRLLQAVRAFFERRGFLEAPTPILVDPPALEAHIDAVAAEAGWLRTSPEFHLKRLMADGADRVYQIGACFRAGEHGRRHRTEFTMLEWYQAGADYRTLRRFTTELVNAVAAAIPVAGAMAGGRRISLDGPWEVISVDEAFRRWAGCRADAAIAADRFDALLVSAVEPHLGWSRPCFLTDYPIALGAFARARRDRPTVAERWELYIGGIELANAYTELIDATEQRRRFAEAAAVRQADGRDVYCVDERFMAAMERGMPEMAGCALGMDRLHMVLAGADDIADVLPFGEDGRT